MDIRRREKWWQLELVIEGERSRRAVSPFKRNDEEATAVLAFFAVLTGILTVFVTPELWILRLSLSILTFLSAILSVTRIVYESGSVTTANSTSTTARESSK